jgi:hypothetical protein
MSYGYWVNVQLAISMCKVSFAFPSLTPAAAAKRLLLLPRIAKKSPFLASMKDELEKHFAEKSLQTLSVCSQCVSNQRKVCLWPA